METSQVSDAFPSLSALRLVATDLDGTLLRSDKTISEYTSSVLQRLRAAGVVIVPISARPPRTLRHFGLADSIGGLAICCNGAIIYDMDRDCPLQQQVLAPPQVEQLIALLHGSLPGLSFAGESGIDAICEAAFYAHASASDPQPPRIVDRSEICQIPQIKILVHHETMLADELHEHFTPLLDSGVYSMTYSSLRFLEISPGGVHKGDALAALSEQLGIAAHEVVAFGDMPNDLPLLRWAGLGVAVANAHPLVLQAADVVTLSNEEDGVAHMLERILEEGLETAKDEGQPQGPRTASQATPCPYR
ncbi:MAG: HAD family phosphatase [Ktedonobacteraceae bacterium]|nr:HAD family phosphatase [Ktedonobacteraceae bacterium]